MLELRLFFGLQTDDIEAAPVRSQTLLVPTAGMSAKPAAAPKPTPRPITIAGGVALPSVVPKPKPRPVLVLNPPPAGVSM